MIGYVTIGTNKFDDAAKFYDELFRLIGEGCDLDGNKLNAFCMTGG